MNDLSDDARRLIAAARDAHDATPQARARGDAAVRVALAMHGMTDLPPLGPPPAPAPAGAETAPAATSAGLGLKIGLGASAAAVLAASVLVAYQPAPGAGRSSAKSSAAVVQKPAAAAPAGARMPASAPATTAVDPALGIAAPALGGGASIARPARNEPASRRMLAHRATARARSGPETPVTIAAEVRLISTANGLILASRYDEALRVLDTHAQRFPRGALREERSALRVLSLCGTAANGQAQRERARFLRRSPQSVLTERVRAACAAPSERSP